MTMESFTVASSHCEKYVETYRDAAGNVIHFDDWRLPTAAEIGIIIDFQYKTNAAMDEVLAGKSYYSASGAVSNPNGSSTNSFTATRCIRDAY